MPTIIDSIRAEFARYRTLAERSFEQLRDEELSQAGPGGGNSIAIICWHVSGNLRSRFTDFLTTDGEKGWRRRDEEFLPREVGRTELLEKWNGGWRVLEETLATLTDDHLPQRVTIRTQPMTVHEALHRALAHLSYHVGQIVYLAKARRGGDWKTLSIPRGASEAVNEQMRADAARPRQG